jgi:hypothetical protein
MSLGFGFRERLTGSYYLLSSPLEDRAVRLHLVAKVDGIRKFLRDKLAVLEGEIDLEGFAEKKPISGTIGLKLIDEGRIPYDFRFEGDDGKIYRFQGRCEFTPIAIADSLTVLPASLYDDARHEIGRAVLRFDIRGELMNVVRSFRVTSDEPWLRFLRSPLSRSSESGVRAVGAGERGGP